MKPDIGVGAAHTWKMENDEDLDAFYDSLPAVPYVMEEFIQGDLCSYEAILNADCEPLFENMTIWPVPIMNIVNDDLDLNYYTCPDVPKKLRKIGRKTAHSAEVYQIYAEMAAFNELRTKISEDSYYCVYAGRKEGHVFRHTHKEILDRYGSAIVMQEEMPVVNWPQMGRFMYTARFRTLDETQAFIDFVQS